MTNSWTLDIATALGRLMEDSWYPSHVGLDSIFGGQAIDTPQEDHHGNNVSKPKRLRAAFLAADQSGREAVVRLAIAVIEEMRFKNVFTSTNENRDELIESLHRVLAAGSLTLDAEGRVQRGFVGAEVEAGARTTVERLQEILRSRELDPGEIIGTAKDLLEATAKHLIHEHDPDAKLGDMPGIVAQAMTAARLTRNPNEIPGADARGIAKARQQVTATAEAVTMLRNRAGDGHGHLVPTEVDPDLANYLRHMTQAIVAFQLATVDRRARSRVQRSQSSGVGFGAARG